MAQYFENDPSLKLEKRDVDFRIRDKAFHLESANGVFSSDKLDTGTRILLECVLEESAPARTVLDLGCGIGVMGVVVSAFWDCEVTGVEINERAALLAKKNYARLHVKGEVFAQDGLDAPALEGRKFSCILLNPPIRTGKKVMYALFEQACSHLEPDGALWIVIRKQHGAQSAVDYLESLGNRVERVARDKGFWVLKVTK